ncbi:hypothetical protein [Anaerospora hongkongensis]|uniref:hypothetical protein n=1 Tax=Anaerospora hongkongensis TaxID=244830 RepID=UPI0028981689|nr:hypothetical protein [Anaerospora hongkongensis]
MKMKFGFLKRVVVTALALSVLGSSAALAATENLFGYTVVDAGYSQGLAGAISGERTGVPTTFTSSTKVTGLNSDPALFNFFQGAESRLVLRQYTYSTTSLLPNKILDPVAAAWTPSITEKTWSNVANLHAVATKGKWLYATGYDLAKIAVVNMDSSYTQAPYNYQFPTTWSIPTSDVPTGSSVHGEGLTVVDNNLYALFTVNPNGGYSVYSDSIVVKFDINVSTGALSYVGHLKVGKNAFTLDHYNNKLYVCGLGGMQNAGSANADTRLDIIDLTSFTKTTVTKTSSMTGDFRDITIVDANNAYVFLGNYDASFGNMVGGVYRTTVANLASPSAWTKVSDVNSAGYLWGIYADSNRFWFVKGNQIDIYSGLLASTSDTAAKTFTPTQLGYSGGNLNSAIILAPDQTSTFAARSTSGVAKSFAAHTILAQQARKAAEEAKTGLKTINGQRILSFDK